MDFFMVSSSLKILPLKLMISKKCHFYSIGVGVGIGVEKPLSQTTTPLPIATPTDPLSELVC
jgi:hypothetical protein